MIHVAKRPADRLALPTIFGFATALLAVVAGCTTADHAAATAPLDVLVFPSYELPRDVRLAPWSGSDKIPQMTSNPFSSTDGKVLADFEDGKVAKKGSIAEVLIAVYWSTRSEVPVEIGLMATRFHDPAAAAAVARALQSELASRTKADPRSAGAVLRRGTVVCFLSPTSTADRETWSAMRRLLEERMAKLSAPAGKTTGP